MGCVCVKPTAASAATGNRNPRPSRFPTTASAPPSWFSGDQNTTVQVHSSPKFRGGKMNHTPNHPGAWTVPGATAGEHIAAGWPPWLAAAAAGEAVRGWVPRKATSFEILEKVGHGTYSTVYRARDLEYGGKLMALKKVKFDSYDTDSVGFMVREIVVLRRLDHPNIIKLEGLITSRMSTNLYLVFNYMDHDLSGLSSRRPLPELQIKLYMKQLFLGLDHCHGRGVLHRDIKGSNLLIGGDGELKIADFGLASFVESRPMTSHIVTLWYRAPELLLGATHYGPAVDLWSAGCILAELYAGAPIMPGRNEVEQLHKVFKLCGSPSEEYWAASKLPNATIFKPRQRYKRRVAEIFKDFPAPALALVQRLLAVDPADRGSAASALKSKFFRTTSHSEKVIDTKVRSKTRGLRRESLPVALIEYIPSKQSVGAFGAKARKDIIGGDRRRIGADAGDLSGTLSNSVGPRTMMSEDFRHIGPMSIHGPRLNTRFLGVAKSTTRQNGGEMDNASVDRRRRCGADGSAAGDRRRNGGCGSNKNQI
ncbi:probable serine/threonine-protein kinase At1g09600 [Andrographis paniculata]|uniref:probable serine/threonine-protein kinase At1g09600 n=1 Tax=Andrographis paniculata TaxID=175694 RepID=UPI0021E8BE6D|nr:probable serine/threonine-protein kinase At1g09600 [Andrographis paniculata]